MGIKEGDLARTHLQMQGGGEGFGTGEGLGSGTGARYSN